MSFNQWWITMPSEKSVPYILRHRARFSPLEEIDWRAGYNLGKSFREKLESSKTNIEVSLGKKLWLKSCDLHCVFLDLALIISRINEDGTKVNRREELLEITHDRMWTEEEEKEYESFGYAVNCLLLDVKTLLINIMIFMDVLTQFLNLCIKSKKQPRSSSFARFKKDLKNYRGREIEELKEMIYENTGWFDEIKDLRDDFIVHHPAARHTLEFLDGVAHIPLTTTKKGYNQRHIILGAIAKSISIEKIDSTLSQLKELLREMNEYLCERINTLPFEAEYHKK
jgi:hypothetical protein